MCATLDRWATFLTRAHELDKRRITKELSVDPSIVKAIDAFDRMFNEEERSIYEVRMEVNSRMASAVERAREEGRNQMLMRAHEAGMSNREFAKLFRMDLDEIAGIVGH